MEANPQRAFCCSAGGSASNLMAVEHHNPGAMQGSGGRDVAVLHRFYVFLGKK